MIDSVVAQGMMIEGKRHLDRVGSGDFIRLRDINWARNLHINGADDFIWLRDANWHGNWVWCWDSLDDLIGNGHILGNWNRNMALLGHNSFRNWNRHHARTSANIDNSGFAQTNFWIPTCGSRKWLRAGGNRLGAGGKARIHG